MEICTTTERTQESNLRKNVRDKRNERKKSTQQTHLT